jgi:hypothetical protein
MTKAPWCTWIGVSVSLVAWTGTGDLLMAQRGSPTPPAATLTETSDLQPLVEELGAIGERLVKCQQPSEIAFYNLEQARVLGQIASRCKAEEQPAWLRQMADCLHGAAVNGVPNDKTAYDHLLTLEAQVNRAQPGSDLAAYVTLRRMRADYFFEVAKSGSDYQHVQEHWRSELARFIQSYPRAAETAEVALELATLCEGLGKDGDAKKYYQYLLDNFPHHEHARKAHCSLNRLDLDGKVLYLTLPLLTTEDASTEVPFDLDQLRGKVVVIYFWTHASPHCAEDLGALKALREHYQDQGMELLCVNLDKTADEGREYLLRMPTPGVHVHLQGGLGGKMALSYGLSTLPAWLVVAKDGRVVGRCARRSEVEDQVQKHLNDPDVLTTGAQESRIRHSPWKR